MSAIGYVTKQEDGSFTGHLVTMSVRAPIIFVPVTSKTHANQPDYLIKSRGAEIGAAWIKKGKMSGKDYVAARFAAPELGDRRIYANLGPAANQDDPDVQALIWNQATPNPTLKH